jgi:hypothetical protein
LTVMTVFCYTWRSSFGHVTLMGAHRGAYVDIRFQLALTCVATSMEHANEMTVYADMEMFNNDL